jgi:aquaporin Z
MKKYVAEVIGTFMLVFFGTGAAVFAGKEIGNVGIALAFGLAIVAAAYSIGSISGAHLNPAVSFAMWLSKRLDGKDLIGYVVSQLIGAIVASFAVRTIASGMGLDVKSLGQNAYDKLSAGGAFAVEVILTFIFVTVILMVTASQANSQFAGFVIGLTLVMAILAAIPLTGASLNPARSIGPALFVGGEALKQLWVFILAPLVGGALAAGAVKLLSAED